MCVQCDGNKHRRPNVAGLIGGTTIRETNGRYRRQYDAVSANLPPEHAVSAVRFSNCSSPDESSSDFWSSVFVSVTLDTHTSRNKKHTKQTNEQSDTQKTYKKNTGHQHHKPTHRTTTHTRRKQTIVLIMIIVIIMIIENTHFVKQAYFICTFARRWLLFMNLHVYRYFSDATSSASF